MDDADRAEKIHREGLERILEARKTRPKESANECESCGLEIPSERQIAVQGCTTCRDCQELKEISY